MGAAGAWELQEVIGQAIRSRRPFEGLAVTDDEGVVKLEVDAKEGGLER